ncbi:uncharacterized protein LOC124939339 [Impatiens glandulifera]|uniref:uncharacterized protein LOC124939339 n=1 Tax=Impatiens glandulifera TaxID=253017 RepID=UPI001FB0E687|nr:uncharacterized protein LOC124939339 [Impatiens glandulifera]
MENFLRSKNLWSLVKDGVEQPERADVFDRQQHTKFEETQTKDYKLKHYLFLALDRATFEQVLDRSSAKSIWVSLKGKYGGNERVKKSLLNTLRREFEILEIKHGEAIKDYFSKILGNANRMRSNGDQVADSIIFEKKFLKAKEEEQVLRADVSSRSRGRSTYRRRGRGRGRPYDRVSVECCNCHQLGHYRSECPKWQEKINYAKKEKEEILLMALVESKEMQRSGMWYIDYGCSNHMCGEKKVV